MEGLWYPAPAAGRATRRSMLGGCRRRLRRLLREQCVLVDTEANLERWARLVRKLYRIRRLQRLWHNLGEHLKVCVGESVRGRLRKVLLNRPA